MMHPNGGMSLSQVTRAFERFSAATSRWAGRTPALLMAILAVLI